MRKFSIWQIPILAIWWTRRKAKFFYWGCYHSLSGALKFKSIGRNVKFNGNVRVERPFSNIVIGNNVMFGIGCYIAATNTGRIMLGDNVLINDNCYITSNYSINIGDNTLVAENVSIRDYNHEFSDINVPIAKQGLSGKPITIGCDVWIGRGVTILAGVTIGNGCIVGANAVVTKDLPDYSVAVGIPAKVISNRNDTYE